MIAGVAALLSMLWVPPDRAYGDYINWSVLILLFCLMAVVAGFRRAGVLDWLSQKALDSAGDTRILCRLLVLLCFFSSMLVTNDVALLTFVPLAVVTLAAAGHTELLIFTVVFQTIAANLGSMLTPVGNPQNLFLFSHYQMDPGAFFQVTVPLTALSLLLLWGTGQLVPKSSFQQKQRGQAVRIQPGKALLSGAGFLLSLLAVFRVLPDGTVLLGVLILTLAADWKLLGKVDYSLLLTFLFFFVFVGNLARVPAVSSLLQQWMQGREMWISVLASQVLSNVPATVLLAPFTADGAALVVGSNLGGLGTLIASMASLISYKIYGTFTGADRGRYLLTFTVWNLIFLAVLLAAACLIF